MLYSLEPMTSLALGYQIALLLHPVTVVPNWWQLIIVLKNFLKNCALINLYTLKNYEASRFNKNKKYAIGQLNWYGYKVRTIIQKLL